jgi:hypothetical protein
MKYVVILFLFITSMSCKTTIYNGMNNKPLSSKSTDSLSLLFKKIDYSDYIGKPIDDLLQIFPLNSSQVIVDTFDEPTGSLSYAQLVYSTKVFIQLYPDINNLKYVNRYSPTLKWDINLVKKEKILRIRLYVEGEEIIFSKGYVKRYPH